LSATSEHVLTELGVDELVACSEAFAVVSAGATTMVETAAGIAAHLQRCLVTTEGAPACALVRVYKTHRFDDLGPDLKAFARDIGDGELTAETRCLTLLGSAGVVPSWNDPTKSHQHRAIPLSSEATVEQAPMVAHLIRQLGLDIKWVVRPDPTRTVELHHRDYGVFYVPDALGSPLVPAQADFVEPYGIRSVVGCGGVLPSGDMFALIVFGTVRISDSVADLFRSLALSVKAALVPFTFKVFSPLS
jgi:hypothetical protein